MPEDLMTTLRAGRLGRGPFLWTAAALTAVTAAAIWRAGFSIVFLGWPFLGLWLLAAVLRLRDAGRSVWAVLVPVLAVPAAAFGGAIIGMTLFALAGVQDGLGLAAIGFWAGMALGVVVWLGFFGWLAVVPTTRRPCA